MNSRPLNNRSLAFTLVELLTVITIIAILMGLLFPAIAIAKEQARRAQAKSDVMQIAAAVKQYYAEYGKYPLGIYNQSGGSQNPSDVLIGGSYPTPPFSNEMVFDILRHTGKCITGTTDYNPRAIVFFEGKNVADPTSPKGGFVSTMTGAPAGATLGAYMDPWGNEYGIAIDGNYDNVITDLTGFYNDFAGTAASPGNAPRVGVAVFAIGKDHGLGTAKSGGTGDGYYKNPSGGSPSDDIVSWQ
jgi:prepilin-type N-terminal cleavage/methylation domain-containing protein